MPRFIKFSDTFIVNMNVTAHVHLDAEKNLISLKSIDGCVFHEPHPDVDEIIRHKSDEIRAQLPNPDCLTITDRFDEVIL